MFGSKKGKHFKKLDNLPSRFSTVCFDFLESVFYCIVLVSILMTCVFTQMTVVGSSMMNTLQNDDKIIIWKMCYTPKNGDVIAISRGKNFDKHLIKRVIATEGQTIKIDPALKFVEVNGKEIDEKAYLKEPMNYSANQEILQVVPEGYCFVMGDNRNHSADSRVEDVGLIKYNDIIGKAFFVYYPLNRARFIN